MKNKIQKRIATTMVLLVAFSNLAFGEVALKDVDTSSEYALGSIRALSSRNIIKGDENGYFNPHNTVRRGEMVTMMVRALGVDTYDLPERATFKDVPVDHWAFKYVEAAYGAGIVKGISADEFGVDLESTREQMAAVFVRALGSNEGTAGEEMPHVQGLADKDQVSEWAMEEVEVALATGLMKGVGNNAFDPKGAAKREQVAVMIHRIIDSEEAVEHPHLFSTLEKYANLQYQGEIHTKLSFSLRDAAEETQFLMEMGEYSIVNGTSMHSKGQTKMVDPEGEDMEIDHEMMIIGNKLFIKDFEENMWLLLEGDEIILNDGEVEGYVIGRELYQNYRNLTIIDGGEVEIDGQKATKYVVQLNEETLLGLMPGENFEMLALLMEDLDQEELQYALEIYINENHEILQLQYAFEGTIEVEGEVLEVKVLLQLNFTNIGKEMEIQEPDASEITVFNFDDFDFGDLELEFNFDDLELDELGLEGIDSNEMDTENQE